jgi:hypothetical protein
MRRTGAALAFAALQAIIGRAALVGLLLFACAACASGGYPSTSPDATPQTASRTLTTTRTAPPTAAVPELRIQIACPANTAGPWSWFRATYGYSIQPGTTAITEYGITYGDGGHYITHDAATAEREEYWHKYQGPGSFLVHAWVVDGSGARANAACNFAWSRTEAVPSPTPGGGGRTGAICRDGWSSSATGSGACSYHGGVAYWTY